MTNALIIEDLTLVPVPAWWENPWVWVAVAGALGIAIYFFRRWWKNRPRPVAVPPPTPPGPPPHLEALRRLAELRTRYQQMPAYDAALECSDILRTYIQARFTLPIRYQTTREFLGAAQTQPLLNEAQRAELGEFLRFFDLVKFARASARPEQTLSAIDYAENFIRQCIPPGSPMEAGA